MTQTAVEWLLENLISEPYSEKDFEHNKNCWDKAELMEKEQIMHAYGQGAADEAGEILDATKDSEEYYNKKYGGNK
jgi:hypothetical protein